MLCLQLPNVAHLVRRVHGQTKLGDPSQGSVAGLLLQVSCSPKELLGIVGLAKLQARTSLGMRGQWTFPNMEMLGAWRLRDVCGYEYSLRPV